MDTRAQSSRRLRWSGTGSYAMEVVGTGFYREHLASLAQNRNGQPALVLCAATLSPETSNAHDPNAVAVLIGGAKVGHLARETALRYRESLGAHGMPARDVECDCAITGGLVTADRQYNYVVELDVDTEIPPGPAGRKPAVRRLPAAGTSEEIPGGVRVVKWISMECLEATAWALVAEPWTTPDWTDVNFYLPNRKRVGPGHKLLALSKAGHDEQALLGATATVVAVDGRWATIDVRLGLSRDEIVQSVRRLATEANALKSAAAEAAAGSAERRTSVNSANERLIALEAANVEHPWLKLTGLVEFRRELEALRANSAAG